MDAIDLALHDLLHQARALKLAWQQKYPHETFPLQAQAHLNRLERSQTVQLISEGKTKQIYDDHGTTVIVQKDDITAGDGARKHTIPGKGEVAAQTTMNVFRYLDQQGIATHFIGMIGQNQMVVRQCRMIPLEVVSRRLATGSFLKRHPEVPEGTRFQTPLVEFFLKDDAKHDPLISTHDILHQGILHPEELVTTIETATQVFLALERAWEKQNVTLVDLKIEFGHDVHTDQLFVADVIDNDSWRIWPEGKKALMLDKQIYRNLPDITDAALQNILANYRQVQDMTGKFIEI